MSRALLIFVTALLLGAAAGLASAAESVLDGADSTFILQTPRGGLLVRMYRPERGGANRPVWVVMHGLKRNAEAYYKAWRPHARERGALLLVPEFDAIAWPKSWGYQLGNVMTADREPVPRDQWAFTALEQAVDEGVRRSGLRSGKFSLYGHGAGAQFVQRYVLHTGGGRLALAVAANAGWYLLPDGEFEFPYGLADLRISDDTLRAAFSAPHVILLGRDDIRTDGVIRRNEQANAQGPHRLARGRFYFERAQAAAKQTDVPFFWRLEEVSGAGHREGSMMPAAVKVMSAAPAE